MYRLQQLVSGPRGCVWEGPDPSCAAAAPRLTSGPAGRSGGGGDPSRGTGAGGGLVSGSLGLILNTSRAQGIWT